jgi:hypothetical protein
MKNLLAVLGMLGLMAVASPNKAAAQTMNMDMSWGVNNQMMYQARSDAYARYLAQWYYNYMQMLRRNGYTGPSLPTGFNAATIMQSNQAGQAAFNSYMQGLQQSSNRMNNSAADYDLRAIRGCQLVAGANGNRYYVCP